MMSLIRFILGKLILMLDRMFSPEPAERSVEEQSKLDLKTKDLVLYQFESCPFCVKVRRAIRRMNLNIELRDARNNSRFKDELLREGGQSQVPCLKISKPGAKAEWLYESDDIISYLESQLT